MLKLTGGIKQEEPDHFFGIFSRTDVTNFLQKIRDNSGRDDSAAIYGDAVNDETVADLSHENI